MFDPLPRQPKSSQECAADNPSLQLSTFGYPSRLGTHGTKRPQCGDVREDQLLPEFAQHLLAVVRFTKTHRRHAKHAAYMPAEGLGRRVIQFSCHARNRLSAVLE